MKHKTWHSVVYAAAKRSYYDTTEWQKLRRKIIRRDVACLLCHSTGSFDNALTVHHVVPRDKGGLDIAANLATLCGRCHDEVETHLIDNRVGFISYLLSRIPPTSPKSFPESTPTYVASPLAIDLPVPVVNPKPQKQALKRHKTHRRRNPVKVYILPKHSHPRDPYPCLNLAIQSYKLPKAPGGLYRLTLSVFMSQHTER